MVIMPINSNPRKYFPKILIDQNHQQAWATTLEIASRVNPGNPADSSYEKAIKTAYSLGYEVAVNFAEEINQNLLTKYDILILPHNSDPLYEKTNGSGEVRYNLNEIESIVNFVKEGGSLLVLSEYEINKYGNNANELLEKFEVQVTHGLVQDKENSYNGVASWVEPVWCTNDPLRIVLYRSGWVESIGEHEVLVKSSQSADPSGKSMGIIKRYGKGCIIVLADSDIFGDDSIDDLQNIIFFERVLYLLSHNEKSGVGKEKTLPPSWYHLKDSVNNLRLLQNDEGSVKIEDKKEAESIAKVVLNAYILCASELGLSDRGYIQESVKDFQQWIESGMLRPDFSNTLKMYRPDLVRIDQREDLILMPMYTQNGHSKKVFEAIFIKTVWPDWIREVEKEYSNPAFIPVEFVDFTEGYNTHSAVFFPETVTISESMQFNWGAIFCDREAARFIKVSKAAIDLLGINTPEDLKMLLENPKILQETFILWDLVHDRTHSRGDLPFDPFMIKQRNPYWMYSLEEMRCDLNAYLEMDGNTQKGYPHGRFVKYAVLFDRVLRFPLSGGRVKNYDGLVGQILFGKLHKDNSIAWSDNKLTIYWDKVDNSVAQLCAEINGLYKDSIDKPKLSFWVDGYTLVSKYVEPNLRSTWRKGPDYLKDSKELVDAILPDEFPLNMFYEALLKKISGVIEECKGIDLNG